MNFALLLKALNTNVAFIYPKLVPIGSIAFFMSCVVVSATGVLWLHLANPY
jgi:hypothetical protein